MPGVSPYAYVGNDPLGYTDRSGLSGESPQSTPLEPASGGGGGVEQGLRWWQIERLLGNSGPDDGRLGQRKPKRKRDRVVMGPPSPPKGDRGAKIVPPPIIVNAPPGVRWVSGSNEVLDAGASLAVVIAVGAGTSGDWTDYLSAGFTFLVAATIATYMDVEYSVTTGELPFVFEEGAITPEDILGEATEGEGDFDWSKEGGFDQANGDFDRITGSEPVSYPNDIRVKELPDGRRLVVRPYSKGRRGVLGPPTLEIQVKVPGSFDDYESNQKIRYR